MKWNSKTIKHIATTGVLSGINIDSFFFRWKKRKRKIHPRKQLILFFLKNHCGQSFHHSFN